VLVQLWAGPSPGAGAAEAGSVCRRAGACSSAPLPPFFGDVQHPDFLGIIVLKQESEIEQFERDNVCFAEWAVAKNRDLVDQVLTVFFDLLPALFFYRPDLSCPELLDQRLVSWSVFQQWPSFAPHPAHPQFVKIVAVEPR
jgi:hypothetical protein